MNPHNKSFNYAGFSNLPDSQKRRSRLLFSSPLTQSLGVKITMEEQIEKLTFLSPNKERIVKEFSNILNEWLDWEDEVSNITDKPYDHNTQLDVFADGEDMMQKHNSLQARTLTFLNNNLAGHGFIKGMDGRSCDRTDLRLRHRVKHRLQELRIIENSLNYAEGYWSKRLKALAAPTVLIFIVVIAIKSCFGGN